MIKRSSLVLSSLLLLATITNGFIMPSRPALTAATRMNPSVLRMSDEAFPSDIDTASFEEAEM